MHVVVGTSLVLVGSLAHAVWNLLVKRSGAAGAEFVWLYTALVTPVLAALLLLRPGGLAAVAGPLAGAALVSAALHALYAVVLQRAYAVGDLGVVYPLARGSAPVLVALGSVPLLGAAHAGAALWAGVAVVVLGVALLVPGRTTSPVRPLPSVLAGGATGLAVAAYTLWDAYAVARLHVDVLAFLVVASAAQLVVLTAVVLPRPGVLAATVRERWRAAVPVAVLVPLSYGLVLLALEHVDVRVVAAARSTSIAAAAVLGWWLLGEVSTPRRVAGVAVLVLGVVACALAA